MEEKKAVYRPFLFAKVYILQFRAHYICFECGKYGIINMI